MRRFRECVLSLARHAESAVAACFEDGTMKLIRSAARTVDRAGRPLDLCAGYTRFDSEFLHSIKARRPRLNRAGIPILKPNSILNDIHRRISQPINLRLSGRALQSWNGDGEQRLDRPAVQRKLIDALALHN